MSHPYMKVELKITGDNSHTLYVPNLNETYHSKHGAILEAIHVFVNSGLKYFDSKKIKVLEVGFGTGLNTALSFLYSERNKINIDYVGYEVYPLKYEVIEQLNYVENIEELTTEVFSKIHNIDWEVKTEMSNNFSLTKKNKSIITTEISPDFDVIFFDAFAPEVQPEIWSEEVFKKLYNSLKKNGIIVTYCAKGVVKRTLKEVGFKVETLPGPPGKREMTRAVKC